MIKETYYLLFDRKRFIHLAKQRIDEISCEKNRRDKDRHAGQVVEPPLYEMQTTIVRKAVILSLLMVFITILMRWVVGWLLVREGMVSPLKIENNVLIAELISLFKA